MKFEWVERWEDLGRFTEGKDYDQNIAYERNLNKKVTLILESSQTISHEYKVPS